MDIEESALLMREIGAAIREFVAKELAPIIERLDVLEADAGLKSLPRPRVRVAAGREKRS